MSPSTIPYLERLGADLERVAADAARRPALPDPAAPRRRRPDQGRWKAWSGAAAAILVIAWGIGSLSDGGGMFPSSDSRFSQVGSEVGGGGTGDGGLAGSGTDQPLAPETNEDQGRAPAAAPTPAPGYSASGDAAAFDRDIAKIDRDGTLTLKLPDGSFKETFADVVAIAEANGGMLMSAETQGSDTGILTVRIPASRFDRTFTAVSRLGAVRESTVTGKDVTSEYLDLRAHLKIAKDRRDVLSALWAETTTIADTVRVYDELEDAQLRVDDIQGRLNFVRGQTSMSTLKVTLSEREPEPEAVQQDPEVENPSLQRAFDPSVQGFLGVVATVIVGLGYLIPLGVLAGIVALVVMLVRRRGHGAS